MHTLNWKVAE